jgi:hypothetical protein
MKKWVFAHLPVEALRDSRLKDSDKIALAKISELAWENSPDIPETPALYWNELIELLDIGKTRYFDAIKTLEAARYIDVTKLFDRRTVLRPIPPFRNCEPSSSLTDSIKELKKIKDSRRSSVIPESRNDVFKELQEAGIGEPLRSELALDPEIDLEYVRTHIRYAELRKDPVRFLANRLSNRDPLPKDREFAKLDPNGPEARARFVEVFGEDDDLS